MKKLILFFTVIALTCGITITAEDETPTVSASKVSFKYCEASYGSVTIGVGGFPVQWEGHTFNHAGTYVVTMVNHRGCDSIVTLTINYKEGAIPFAFSVASNKQIYFSRGNLQFCAYNNIGAGPEVRTVATGEKMQGAFRFALHQWDYIGSANTNASDSYTGWIDLFRFGASGRAGYNPYGYSVYTKDPTGTNYDWGVFNSISNGGGAPGMWFNMTPAQWRYLLDTRTNAAQKWTYAYVNNVKGLVLLPDTWVLPEGVNFTPATNANNNMYTSTEWARMELNGAVFLPCAGRKYNNPCNNYSGTAYDKIINIGETGCYWISTTVDQQSNYTNYKYSYYRNRPYFYFSATTATIPSTTTTISDSDDTSASLNTDNKNYRDQHFLSVRLVCDAE